MQQGPSARSADVEDGRVGAVPRRRVLQGAAATGVVLSLPVLPLPALGRESEMELVSDTLALDGAAVTADPAPHSATRHGLQTMSARHLRLPVLETDEFRSVALAWDGGPEEGASLRVRRAGRWSEWYEVHVDPSEAPDPDEAPPTERRMSRPLWIDRADAVEVVVPEGVGNLAVQRVRETSRPVVAAAEPVAGAAPWINRRSAWGAAAYRGTPVNSPAKLAIIHHSVNSNSYGPDDVPGIIRGMQRHHQDGNGWNDIAYNFLVDKWGRLWEGRAGGIDRPVIGGHTYGCNSGTIGVCYIGDLRYMSMPPAAVHAVTALLVWKFNTVHDIGPGGVALFAPVTSDYRSKFPAGEVRFHPTVVGHSHFGRTECPASASPAAIATIRDTINRVADVRGIAAAPAGGAWRVTGDGQVAPHGWQVPFYGSMAGEGLNQPMINLAPTASGKGYWTIAADGGIFSFGDAAFHGSTGGMRLNRPVVGMATTRSGKGYWLVASDGGIFSFGDAKFYGSMGGRHLNKPVIGMARTPSGQGYWLFASDGGIFCFGDAQFFGSAGGSRISSPAVGVATHPDGRGYWLALADGTVHEFNVSNHGRAWQPSGDPIVGIAATSDGGGYWLAARSGKVIAFGNAT